MLYVYQVHLYLPCQGQSIFILNQHNTENICFNICKLSNDGLYLSMRRSRPGVKGPLTCNQSSQVQGTWDKGTGDSGKLNPLSTPARRYTKCILFQCDFPFSGNTRQVEPRKMTELAATMFRHLQWCVYINIWITHRTFPCSHGQNFDFRVTVLYRFKTP